MSHGAFTSLAFLHQALSLQENGSLNKPSNLQFIFAIN